MDANLSVSVDSGSAACAQHGRGVGIVPLGWRGCGTHTASCHLLFAELPQGFSDGPRDSCLHCSSAEDMCAMGPRWHNQDLLSVVFDWDLGKITRLLSPAYPKHACLLLQFLLRSIVARMDLCWAISHSSCVITNIVMRTQKQRMNALCLPKNRFVPLHCCDLRSATCWWLLGILRCQSDSLLSHIAWLECVKLPSEERFPEDRSGVSARSLALRNVCVGFGARSPGHAQPSSLHQKALLDRARPGGVPTPGVTSPESPPRASVSPLPSALRNGDQCDTQQLDVIKSPKELVKPHPCFRKPRSNQMPSGSSAWHRATEGEETVPSLFLCFPIVLHPALISSLLERFAMGPEGKQALMC